MEVKINESNFKEEVLNSTKPVLVDFWATWCGPCRMLSPVIEEIAAEKSETLKVGKVNVDEEPALATQFGIASIPMLVLFKNGKVVRTSVGYQPKEEILKLIEQHFQNPPEDFSSLDGFFQCFNGTIPCGINSPLKAPNKAANE